MSFAWSRLSPAIPLFLAYFLLQLIGILAHEPWFDELQAWVIARDSHSIPELIRNLRYEHHPVVWYFLLKGVQLFTLDPLGMQLLHLVIASSAVALFLIRAPFEWRTKALVIFGYFAFYEYSILSRNYGIGAALLAGYVVLSKRKPSAIGARAAFLAALSWCNFFSFWMALILSGLLAKERLDGGRKKRKISAELVWMLPLAVVFYLGMLQLAQVRDSGFYIEWRTQFDPVLLKETLTLLIDAFLPVPNFFVERSWGTNVFLGGPSWLGWLLPAWILLVLWKLLEGPNGKNAIRISYFLFLFLVLAFSYLKFRVSPRHSGALAVFLVGCLWMAQAKRPKLRWVQVSALILLIAQFVGGVGSYALDLASVFSPVRDAAGYIKKQGLQSHLLMVTREFPLNAITAYTNQPVYSLRRKSIGTIVRFASDGVLKQDSPPFELPSPELRRNYPGLILLANKSLPERPFVPETGTRLELLQAFTKNRVDSTRDQAIYIYRVVETAGPREGSHP